MSELCKNCGSKNLGHLYEAPAFDSSEREKGHKYGIARCSDCHLANTTGEDFGVIDEAYSASYYGSANEKFLAVIERGVELANNLRARKLLAIWHDRAPTRAAPSVLDIGCGRGQLLSAFRSLGASVLGLERKEFPTKQIDKGFVRTGSIDDREYSKKMFDIIILWHVFEHMEKHDALLASIASHLNENGLLVIAVPNFSSFQQRIFSKYWFHLDLPRHLVHFDSKWLSQRLNAYGFSIEKKGYLDPLQNIFGFIQSAINLMAPARSNDYYALLKLGQHRDRKSIMVLAGWSLMAAILLPFAILDTIFGCFFSRGATLEISARKTIKP